MNRLPPEKRAQILGLMCEGMSIRAIVRMTGASKNTVVKLLEDAGQAFSEFQDTMMRGLKCRRIQVDEVWAFVYAKEKNVQRAKNAPPHSGDVWTWVALDAETKLIPSWFVGDRSAESARQFLLDLHDRLANRVQLTSDGHHSYLDAVSDAFAGEIDFAQLVKIYSTPKVEPEAARRYSPTECIGCDRRPISGDPDPAHISTSYVERSNLSIRMGLRRFTRLRETDIRNVHRLVMQRSAPDMAGQYANQGRYVETDSGRHYFPSPAEVPALMGDFAKWLGTGPVTPETAFTAHRRLVEIHPFNDGNGRTARLVMNLVLLRGGYPPVAVRPQDRPAYIGALQDAQAGRGAEKFDRLLYERLDATLGESLSALRQALPAPPTSRTTPSDKPEPA